MDNLETAFFGGGCFWCMEAVFLLLKGVENVESGYAGGYMIKPTYEEVCSGKSGHAEVIRIDFNPDIISYEELLNVFFYIHDPTTLNRQGNDTGEQYRSVILYSDNSQKEKAVEFINNLNASEIFQDEIVTQVVPMNLFEKAEDYHQDYFAENPEQPYCNIVISPKIKKFKEKFSYLLK